jgi:hypothetical protein
MAKVILAVGALICGVSGQSNGSSEMENKLSALYEQIQKNSEQMAEMEAYAEVFKCLNVEEGKNVVLKEGCDLVVKKGNHKIEGQLHTLGTHIVDGGNLHVHNGSGSPDCSYKASSTKKCNGRGNLIIGHSPESSKILHKDLSGSHNIIVGSGHAVYSHGSIVSGSDHVLLGAHLSAISGISNTAVGEGSAVLGGSDNLAGDIKGTVSDTNDAVRTYATVTGGEGNRATGVKSSVSGGKDNKAKASYSWAAGGMDNKALEEKDWSSAVGGTGNTANGIKTLIMGGSDTQVTTEFKPKLGN